MCIMNGHTVVKIMSKMIAEILTEFYDELLEHVMGNCGNIMIESSGEINIHLDDVCYDVPKDLKDALYILAAILDTENMWNNLWDFVKEGYLNENDLDLSNCAEVVRRLLDNAELVTDSIENMEITIVAEREDFDNESGIETTVTTYDKKTNTFETRRALEQY